MVGATPGAALGAPGDLDADFGTNGIANAGDGDAYAAAVQRDGRVVVAGCTSFCGAMGERGDFKVARFTDAGQLDQSFGNAGVVRTDIGPSDMAHAVAIQADGRIVVAGCTGCDWSGTSYFALARYLPDGKLDRSFGVDGKVGPGLLSIPLPQTPFTYGLGSPIAGGAYGVAIQADGKIIAGGFSGGRFALARYNRDGRPDQGFGSAGSVTTGFGRGALGLALTLQPDGKIVLAGDANDAQGRGDAAVARYRPDGSLDATFSGDGKATLDFDSSYRAVEGVAVQDDGAIVVAGQAHIDGQSGGPNIGVGRLTPSGMPDTSFGSQGVVSSDFGVDHAEGVAIQKDGHIVVTGRRGIGMGSAHRADAVVARYMPTGGLDPTFGSNGAVFTPGDRSHDAVIQSDGKILNVGRIGAPFAVVRHLAD